IPICSVTCFCTAQFSLAVFVMGLYLRTHHSLIFSWDSTRLASSTSLQTTVKPPTRSPEDTKVQTKDWDRRMLCPCSMKSRTAQASRSMSPLANPW
uniref:Uncharacterized protein n=1 Tax=Cyprinus carpio carpio TaxID=630221 RepID=A0A9J8CTG4_CYPCA